MTLPRPPVAVLALALSAAVTLSAQVTRDNRVLRSGVDMVMVTATVLDAEGRLVTGLPREAFEIYEDGDRQVVRQFTHERVPIGLGLLLDISDSMFGQRILDARATVERFLLELLSKDDEFFVLAFNHEPHLLTRWTTEADVVRRALDHVRPTGGTAMYDALVHAMPMIAQRNRERAAIVLVSDGADTASDASLKDVRTALLRSDAFVYAVAIDSPKTQAINTRVNPAALGEITSQSGGHTAVVRDADELAAATARIAEELNSQYVLGYSSPRATDGKYHSIRVALTSPGHRVRARNGYVATMRSSRSK
ncbi:MAG TPA: VWA domain-containing protein [Vicinamibacterales bacterium]|nr:VWA domain-containing protein [Vicinamibacterales bacterium]